jgi:hypothetical protein
VQDGPFCTATRPGQHQLVIVLHDEEPAPPQDVICGAPLSAKSPQTPDVPDVPSALHMQPLATEFTEQTLVEIHTAPVQQLEVVLHGPQ